MKLTGAITILSLTGSAWAAHQAYEFVYDTTPVGQDAATSYGMAAQTDMSAEPTMVMDQGMMTKSMAYEMPTKAAGMAGAAMHTVTIGGSAGLIFSPTEVIAAVGDMVHFVFLAKNHTITQSTFDKPCVKKADGIDSGFQPNPKGDKMSPPTFMITVKTTEPTWWYCRQRQPTSHCGQGMVFAINPTVEKSFAVFKGAALAQNGTAATASTAAASPVTLSVDNGGLPGATTTNAIVSMPTATSLAPGWNNQGNQGACSCACFCGVAAFPVGAGAGAYGGMAGSMPAPW